MNAILLPMSVPAIAQAADDRAQCLGFPMLT